METPCQSAQQLSARLAIPDVTPAVVARLLYGEVAVFEVLGPEQPSIWGIRPEAEELVASWRDDVPERPETPVGSEDRQSSEGHRTPDSCYTGPPLRAWQIESLDTWSAHRHHGLVEAVTGSGKTAVGIRAVAMALDEGRQSVVLVPGIDLQNQWFEALRTAIPSYRIDRLGGTGLSRPPARWDVLVAVVNTAARTPIPAAAGSLLVADEVHRYGAGTFAKALTDSYEWRLGLTATLERSDDAVEEVLLPYFGRLVPGCDYARAQADGILAPVKMALVGVHFTARERALYDRANDVASKAKTILIDSYGAPEDSFGAFMSFTAQLAKEGRGESGRTAQRYLKNFAERRRVLADCEGKLGLVRTLPIPELTATKSILFTERTSTAGQVSSILEQAGLPCGYIGSTLKPEDRAGVLDRFRTGTLRALAAPRVLDEGIDVPDAQVGLVLAASRTRRQMVQRMGRVVRPKSDGRTAIFVVAYVYDTPEDPALGAHEAFLEDLTAIADQRETVVTTELVPLLRSWLEAAPRAVAPVQTTPAPPLGAFPSPIAPVPAPRSPSLPTPADVAARIPTHEHPVPVPHEQLPDAPAEPAATAASSPGTTTHSEPRREEPHPEYDVPKPSITPGLEAAVPTNQAFSPQFSDARAGVPVSSETTYLERASRVLDLGDLTTLWSTSTRIGAWMSTDDAGWRMEWLAECLYELSRPTDDDVIRWQLTMRAVNNWAMSSSDPLDEFIDVAKVLRRGANTRTELLKFAADLRGVELVDLL
ncbi:DEAD/DEAH box helicase family protein [Nocardia sp. NPDC057668]|uniref:DEAD/DEAH box helicase n=1 Tax=Nocardia sp. NPDC057668 TaxID=3346202 RepID=UPI00366CE78A